MALSKDKKQAVVDELTAVLSEAKIAVIADYTGLTVKEMQELRRNAKEQGTNVKVVKNRLQKTVLRLTTPNGGSVMVGSSISLTIYIEI